MLNRRRDREFSNEFDERDRVGALEVDEVTELSLEEPLSSFYFFLTGGEKRNWEQERIEEGKREEELPMEE